jgi:hypothetical protein
MPQPQPENNAAVVQQVCGTFTEKRRDFSMNKDETIEMSSSRVRLC